MENNLGNLARKTQNLGKTPTGTKIIILKQEEPVKLNTCPTIPQFSKNDFPPLK